jgi:hypothetical protein
MAIKQVFHAIKESGSSIESKKTMSGIVLYSYGNKYSLTNTVSYSVMSSFRAIWKMEGGRVGLNRTEPVSNYCIAH